MQGQRLAGALIAAFAGLAGLAGLAGARSVISKDEEVKASGRIRDWKTHDYRPHACPGLANLASNPPTHRRQDPHHARLT